MRAIYFDCSPFMEDLYHSGLNRLMPDLAIHIGDPAADELPELLRGYHGVLNGHTVMSAELLNACPDLQAIVFLGTGVSSYVDLDVAEQRGILVRAIAGYGDRTIAEHTLALLFAAARRVATQDRNIRSGEWDRAGGMELHNKTLGLIGLGAVGRQVAVLGTALGMRVIGWNRSGVPSQTPCEAVEIDTVFEESDAVSLHVALTPETTGMVDARRLERMKPGAILINTARGALIEEAALIDSLLQGRLGHAALDVYHSEPLPEVHPLMQLDNVTLTAHTAWNSPEASERLLRRGLEQLRDAMSHVSES